MRGETQEQGVRRSDLTLIGNILLIAALVGLLVPTVLATVQLWLLTQTRKWHRPTGALIEVAGTWIHLDCEGTSPPGVPTIVIDAGNAGFSLDWAAIQRELATSQRVCTYDRAGYGWSSPRPGPRDADHAVTELHVLLQESGEPGPFLLVGHALGGVHARLYAARYPDEVAGLVLIDTLADAMPLANFEAQQQATIRFYNVMGVLVKSGALRVLRPLIRRSTMPPTVRALPEDVQAPYRALLLDPAHYETAIAEMEALPVSLDQARAALKGDLPLGKLPLVVLTAARATPPDSSPCSEERVSANPDVIAGQGELARLSVRGERRMLGQSGHLAHVDAPSAVLAAVRDVSELARTRR